MGEETPSAAFRGASFRHGSHDGLASSRARRGRFLRDCVRVVYGKFQAAERGTGRAFQSDPQIFRAVHARNRGAKGAGTRAGRFIVVSRRRARTSDRSAERIRSVRRARGERGARLRFARGDRACGEYRGERGQRTYGRESFFPAVYGGAARSRSDHPHGKRTPSFQFFALAERVRGIVFFRKTLPRFFRSGSGRGAERIRGA